MRTPRRKTRTFLPLSFALTFAGMLLLFTWTGWQVTAKRVEPGEPLGRPAQDQAQNVSSAEVSEVARAAQQVGQPNQGDAENRRHHPTGDLGITKQPVDQRHGVKEEGAVHQRIMHVALPRRVEP